MKWLLVLAQSGVSIPVSTFSQTAAFIRDFGADFETYEQLMECIATTCWIKSDAVVDLLALVASLHERLRDWMYDAIVRGDYSQSMSVIYLACSFLV